MQSTIALIQSRQPSVNELSHFRLCARAPDPRQSLDFIIFPLKCVSTLHLYERQ